jgi:hypothetical protein
MNYTRTVVIGDVHGCLDEFVSLVETCVQPRDRVICIGDFLDKGPDPVGCVQYARTRGFEAVLGNHEDWHLRWRRHENRVREQPGYVNPMRPHSPEDIEANRALEGDDIAWLRNLPVYIIVGRYVVVHGGLMPGVPVEKQEKNRIIRLRWLDSDGDYVATRYDAPRPDDSQHWTEVYDGNLSVIYGHEAFSLSQPRITNRPQGVRCIGIDTGVVHGGRLTAFIVEEDRFVQVQARERYASPLFPIPA